MGRPKIKDEELKQLAKDCVNGKIFSTDHIPKEDRSKVLSIFAPIGLMDDAQYTEFSRKKPEFIYEYLDKASPTSINGYPIFFSFRYLNKKEYDIFFDYYRKITSTIEEI
jgi:hypothetical protein